MKYILGSNNLFIFSDFIKRMIKPTPEDVMDLKNYSTDNFKVWLRKGLEGYLLKNDIWDFEPMAVFIGQDDGVSLDLINICNALPEKTQENFYQAVENLIRDKEYNKRYNTENRKIILENLLRINPPQNICYEHEFRELVENLVMECEQI